MRTTKAHILPGCVYCNFDHDPAIECRLGVFNYLKGV
jgi:hypothetical protein